MKKIDQKYKFLQMFFFNSNFSENLDLLPWIQKSLLLSQIQESMCVREGELKIKFKKEGSRNQKRDGNFYIKKKNWRGGRTVRKREKRRG
jgi:hypothetical protein